MSMYFIVKFMLRVSFSTDSTSALILPVYLSECLLQPFGPRRERSRSYAKLRIDADQIHLQSDRKVGFRGADPFPNAQRRRASSLRGVTQTPARPCGRLPAGNNTRPNFRSPHHRD